MDCRVQFWFTGCVNEANGPLGTPATAKGRATRDRVVDAACDLVFERGVAALNLDDVRQATATSKSQLYHYFADRSDLVRAVVVRQGERVLGLHQSALESVDGWAGLSAWRDFVVSLAADAGCHGGCPVGSLANELAEVDDVARLRLVEIFDDWEVMLTEALRRMVARGELVPGADVEGLALALLASLQGGLLLAKTRRDLRCVEVALDAALGYLKASAGGQAARTPTRRARSGG
jgi:TetR/AcrR family transcriptional regulator, transcriptional repressor for nem operon